MSIADGIRLATEWSQDRRARDESERAARWRDEQQAQQRAEWERQQKARSSADSLMAEGIKGYEAAPQGIDPAFLTQYGLQRQLPQSGYAQRQGFEPNMETPKAPAPSPARQRALDDMRAARGIGGIDGLNAYRGARKQVDDEDRNSQFAQLHDAVLNAPPEKVAAFAKTYSDNSTAPGKLTQGKDGLMTLTLDGGENIPMSRPQVAAYITGLYKMQKGDHTGLADIAGVHEKLAAATQHLWTTKKDVVSSSNDAWAKRNAAANDNERTRHSAAQLGLSRERVKAAVDAEKMGLVRQYQDPKTGEVKEMYPVTTKAGGITWEEVPMPEGMKPYHAPGKGMSPRTKVEEAGQAYRNQNGQLEFADGRGGFITEGGVYPDEQAEHLKKAGIPENLIGALPWSSDGRYVGMNGKKYDVNNPADMRALRNSFNETRNAELQWEEAKKAETVRTQAKEKADLRHRLAVQRNQG